MNYIVIYIVALIYGLLGNTTEAEEIWKKECTTYTIPLLFQAGNGYYYMPGTVLKIVICISYKLFSFSLGYSSFMFSFDNTIFEM